MHQLIQLQSLKGDAAVDHSEWHGEVEVAVDENNSHAWPRSLIFLFWQSSCKNIHSATATSSKITIIKNELPRILVYHPSLPNHSTVLFYSRKSPLLFRWPTSCPSTVWVHLVITREFVPNELDDVELAIQGHSPLPPLIPSSNILPLLLS
jgi:hypothetical protein